MIVRRLCRPATKSHILNAFSKCSTSPAIALPRSITTSSTSTDPDAPVWPLTYKKNPHSATRLRASDTPPQIVHQPKPTFMRPNRLTVPPPAAPPLLSTSPLPQTVTTLLPSLALQTPHYASIHIHKRPYLVTEGDRVRLPFRMPGVKTGDVLRLTRATVLGSRDFTLRGSPWVDERLFECRAVVVGVEAEPMRSMEKTKRRNRRVKTVRSKHRYTEVVVRQLKVKSLEEVVSEDEARD